MSKFIDKPKTGDWRENERWERDVSMKVTSSEETLSDVDQRYPPPLQSVVEELEKRIAALEQNMVR